MKQLVVKQPLPVVKRPAGGEAAGGQAAPAGGQAAGGQAAPAGGQAAGGQAAPAGGQAAGGQEAPAGGQAAGGQAAPAGGEAAPAGGQAAPAGGQAAGGAPAGGQPAPQFDAAQTYSCALNPSADQPYYCVEASGALCIQSPQTCQCEGDAANPVEAGNACAVGCAFKCELFAGALTQYFYNYASIDELGFLGMACGLQGGNVVACD